MWNSWCLGRREARNEVCTSCFFSPPTLTLTLTHPLQRSFSRRGLHDTSAESWFTKKRLSVIFVTERGAGRVDPFPRRHLTHKNGSFSRSHKPTPPPRVWRFVHGGQVSEASYWSASSSRSGQPRPRSRDARTGSVPRSERPGEGRVESPSSPHNLSFSFT